MKKRESSFKQKRREEQARRKRMYIIGGVILAGIIIAAILIAISQPPPAVGSFVTPQPVTWTGASGSALGPENAKVVVKEFSDFQCPYCRRFHDTVFPQILKDYVDTGKIRFEYHHYLVIDKNTGGNESHRATIASLCAADQGRFWDYHNMLFANQQAEASGAFSDTRLKAFADAMGLDTTAFNSCLDSNKYASQITSDEAQAATFGLQGTPSILVNNVVVANPMNYADVKTAIDAALAKGQ